MNQRGEYGNTRSGQDYYGQGYYDAAAAEYVGGERGERGERGGWRSWRGWGGRGWGGRAWPVSYGLPYYSSSYAVPSYSYALPAYDITDSGYVYPTGQSYVPSYGYGYGWPSYALPFYGAAATVFPHWRSRRHFLHRHRRRIYDILGAEVD